MQQTSKSLLFLKYGVSIGFLLLFFLIYQTEFNNTIQPYSTNTTAEDIPRNSAKKVEADFFIDDQPNQQHFNTSSLLDQPNWNGTISFNNGSLMQCTCPSALSAAASSSSLYSTQNISYVRHGEKQPIFVPDYLSPLQSDIFDKIMTMRHDDIKIRGAEDNGILITIAGYAMRHELFNWMQLLKDVEEDRFIIFCTDLKMYMSLIVAGYEDYAVFIPDDWLPSQDLHLFRNTKFNMLDATPARTTHVKTWVLQRLIYTMGINNILYLDVNQIMLHPRTREYLTTLLNLRWDTEFIASQDGTDQKTINTGLVMLRTDTKSTKRLLANTIQIQETQPHLTQQQALNLAMDQLDLHLKNGNTVLLDVLFFPNGNQYFERNLPGSIGIEPYNVHVNHKVRGERVNIILDVLY